MNGRRRIKILVLAGTTDAKDLCFQLSRLSNVEVIASLAGNTTLPARYEVPVRSGGFGGADGLAEFLRSGGYSHLVDATHPFASRITSNATAAAANSEVKLARLARPSWRNGQDGCWKSFPNLNSAIHALPTESIVFGPLGSGVIRSPARAAIDFRADCTFLIRVAEPVLEASPPGNCRVIVARPPFGLESELAQLARHDATCLLCRNSGGLPGLTKLRAAATLRIPVFMVERPATAIANENCVVFATVTDTLNWILSSIELRSKTKTDCG